MAATPSLLAGLGPAPHQSSMVRWGGHALASHVFAVFVRLHRRVDDICGFCASAPPRGGFCTSVPPPGINWEIFGVGLWHGLLAAIAPFRMVPT